MKNFLVLFLFFTLSLKCLSQGYQAPPEDYRRYRVYKNSLGVGFISSRALQTSGLSGVGILYKRFQNKSAITGSINVDLYRNGRLDLDKDYHAFEARVGYERHMDIGHFMPILGTEAMLGKKKNERSYNNQSLKDNVFNYGISPYLGLHTWVNHRISINLTTRLDLYHTNRLYESVEIQNNREVINIVRTTGVTATYAFFGICTVSYHFL